MITRHVSMQRSSNKGFTIVELLIVIIVIGILAGITIISYNLVTQKSHDTALTSDLNTNADQIGAAKAKDPNGQYATSQSAANLQSSNGNTLTYLVSSDYKSYCLQASGFGSTFYVTNSSPNAQAGSCPGSFAPVAAAPTIASSSVAPIGGGTGASITVPVPSGSTPGSLIILHVFAEYFVTTQGTAQNIITPPTNFKMAYSQSYSEDTNTYQEYNAVYYGYFATGDTGYKVNFATLGGQYPDGVEWASALRITGATATTGNPFVDNFKEVYSDDHVSTTITMPNFTPGADNSLILVALGDPANIYGSTHTYPSGWTKVIGGTGVGSYGSLGYMRQTTAAATGTPVFTSTRDDGKYVIFGTIR